MQHGSSGRRSRKRRKGNRRNKKNRQTVYDSNGPDVRIRGTAHQVSDKYEAMAKDALSTNDYVLAQSYLQHAEHYQRIINDWDDTIREYGSKKQKQSEKSSAKSIQGGSIGNRQKSSETADNKSKSKELENA